MTNDQIDTGAGEIIQAEGYAPFSAGSKAVAKRVGFSSGLIERKNKRKPRKAEQFKPGNLEW
jgi:hypothetical protein